MILQVIYVFSTKRGSDFSDMQLKYRQEIMWFYVNESLKSKKKKSHVKLQT